MLHVEFSCTALLPLVVFFPMRINTMIGLMMLHVEFSCTALLLVHCPFAVLTIFAISSCTDSIQGQGIIIAIGGCKLIPAIHISCSVTIAILKRPSGKSSSMPMTISGGIIMRCRRLSRSVTLIKFSVVNHMTITLISIYKLLNRTYHLFLNVFRSDFVWTANPDLFLFPSLISICTVYVISWRGCITARDPSGF